MNLSSLNNRAKDSFPKKKKGCKAIKPTETSCNCETCGKVLSEYTSYRRQFTVSSPIKSITIPITSTGTAIKI